MRRNDLMLIIPTEEEESTLGSNDRFVLVSDGMKKKKAIQHEYTQLQ